MLFNFVKSQKLPKTCIPHVTIACSSRMADMKVEAALAVSVVSVFLQHRSETCLALVFWPETARTYCEQMRAAATSQSTCMHEHVFWTIFVRRAAVMPAFHASASELLDFKFFL